MSKSPKRTPASFSLPEDKVKSPQEPTRTAKRPAQSVDLNDEHIHLTPENEDLFLIEKSDDRENADFTENEHKGSSFSFSKLTLASFGLLVSLAIGLWVDSLVTELFARTTWLGWIATAIVGLFVVGIVGLIMREIFALTRLRSINGLRHDLKEAQNTVSSKAAWQLVNRVIQIVSTRAETAKGRQVLIEIKGDVVDGPELLRLAEIELLGSLDQKAKSLITASAKRVSIVTALSPRALIDTGYVLYEMIRLARHIAELYGARTGLLGTLRLLKNIAAHLAVTGAVSIGDGIVQQMIGQGLAAKFSARFGEGLVNGLMTTRFGIVAMEVTRPMPFKAVKRPAISDFLPDLNTIKGDNKAN